MKKFTFFVLAIFLAAPAFGMDLDAVDGGAAVQPPAATPAAPTASGCVDDPRLQNLGQLIQDIATGKITDPITMTPARFAKLKPVIAKRLKNIMVCPRVAVIDGIVTEKITISWPLLKELVMAAAIRADADELNRLLTSFSVEAMPADQIASLGVVIPATAEMNEFLSSTLKIKLLPTRSRKDVGGILFSDIFGTFGGKSSIQSNLIYFVGSNADEGFVKKGGMVILQPESKIAEEIVQRLMPYGIRGFVNNRDAMEAVGR